MIFTAKIFGIFPTTKVNEWFGIIPKDVTVMIFKKSSKIIDIESYETFSAHHVKKIYIPKISRDRHGIVNITFLDNFIYSLFSFLYLPYIIFHDKIIFITPSYMQTGIIPILNLFRKKVYTVVLDSQLPLYMTYKEKKSPFLYIYIKISELLEKQAIKNADKVFVVSNYLYKKYKKYNKNIFLTPNGSDVELINKIKPKRITKQFTITYMGALDFQRGVDLLINAFKKLKKKHKTKLLIIGGGKNLEGLKRIAADDKDIIFTGYMSHNEAISYCKGSDVLTMTARDDELIRSLSSLKFFEYIACEVPILTTETGDHAYWTKKLDVGLVVNDSVDSIHKGLERLIRNKKLYRKFKQNARKNKFQIDFKNTRKDFVNQII